MKRTGKTNRAKPSDMAWAKSILECAKLFQKEGWFKYFEKIDGYNSKVSYGFDQGLEKYTVLFNTLKIELTRELIAEATHIADEGEFGLRRCHLPLIHRISYYLMWYQIGARVCMYRISSMNGGILLRFCRVI